MHSSLPTPPEDALRHSLQLGQMLQQEIAAAGGAIPFSRFMELVLYTPGWGYYSAGASKIGVAGDFVTAPEMGPLFARTTARALAPVLRTLGSAARVLELGGGTGAFAVECLRGLAALDALPARYAILEPSADLRQRQAQRVAAELPADVGARVEWLDRPFDDDWDGIVFANEVIDALPTPRFVITDGLVHEETVRVGADGRFVAGSMPADVLLERAVRNIERDLGQRLPDGYRSEALMQLPYWIQAVAGGLRRGAMLFVDYGYVRSEYYQADRDHGTLRAFYRHQVHNDVFAWPGLQDITASVDFTAMAEAGTGAGFDLAGYCNQASFLLGNGVDQVLAQAEAQTNEVGRVALREQLKRLTLPNEMGERFGVIGFQRDVDLEAAFALGDLSWRL
jgi:SAM-dependent MidA family methyltransferase